MNEILPLTDIPLGLDKTFFDKYQSFDEKQDLYSDIKKAAAASSWMQADFFKYLWEEFDGKTLNKFAASVNESPGTVNNYIRTAQAFHQDVRNPMATFSHHFQASLADSYDSKTKQFIGTNRYEWLTKALDEHWTTRQLNEEVMRNKRVKELGTTEPCDMCKQTDAQVLPYNFFNTQSKHTDHMNFHVSCYQSLLDFVHGSIDTISPSSETS